MDHFDLWPVEFHHFNSCQQKPNYFFYTAMSSLATEKENYCWNIDKSSLIMLSLFFHELQSDICFFFKGKKIILHLIGRQRKWNKIESEREKVWFKWVLGYAWGLRTLRNIAKMKQAAEHRGKASIQNTIISQQSYSQRHISKKRTSINY